MTRRQRNVILAAIVLLAIFFLSLTGCVQAPARTRPDAHVGQPATTPAPTVEAPICGPRGDLLAALSEEYGERPIWMGKSADGLVAELIAGPRSWTWMVTAPNGTSCLVDAGTEWQAVEVGVGI